MAIGVVTGFTAEARIARCFKAARIATGAEPEAAARRLIAEGVHGLLSFGIAGGLKPGLGPGTMIVATEVIDASERFETAAAWRMALLARLPGAQAGRLLGSDRVVATAAEKALLYRANSALALDMESHAVARAAAAAKLPFAAFRVIADGAAASLPAVAQAALTDQGSIAVGRVLFGLLRRPSDLPALLRLGRDSRAALRALAAGSEALAAGDAGPDAALDLSLL